MSDPFAPLIERGLTLHAVLDLATLPVDVRASLGLNADEPTRYRQLIVLGHQGRAFWAALQRRGLHGSDPVDAFVAECVRDWLNGPLAGHAWALLFPGVRHVGLQRLGELAGWHHAAPFRVGVDAQWGSWFAYRAVLLADTALPLTPQRALPSPCLSCHEQPCVTACPAAALDRIPTAGTPQGQGEGFRLLACMAYRLQPGSACQDRCLARNACRVGEAHRYTEAQTAYHYLQSLPAIRVYLRRMTQAVTQATPDG
jgi:hypothetical protein